MKSPSIAPSQARSERKMIKLQRDNLSTLNGWILLNGPTVIVSQQKAGGERTGKVELPASEFRRIAQWYLTPQRIVRKKRS